MQYGEGISEDGFTTYGSIGHHGLWKGHLVFITAKHVLGKVSEAHSVQDPTAAIGKAVYRSRSLDFCLVKLSNQKTNIPLTITKSYDGGDIIGMEVYKIGAASGRTKGFINFTDGPLHYMVRPFDGSFAEPGDSGAAVFAADDSRPVGILLGQFGLHWVVLSIQAIIDMMGPEFHLLSAK